MATCDPDSNLWEYHDQTEGYPSNGYSGTTTSTMRSTDLERIDFKIIHLKGTSRHYFSFLDRPNEIEICLEPCLDGFCIASYTPDTSMLLEKKLCTKMRTIFRQEEKLTEQNKEISEELHNKLMDREMFGTTQERSNKCWTKALELASKIYRIQANTLQLKRYKLIERDELKADDLSKHPVWQAGQGASLGSMGPAPKMNTPSRTTVSAASSNWKKRFASKLKQYQDQLNHVQSTLSQQREPDPDTSKN
ncbi:hypothetical protein KAW50_03535 [candidate division WOR-3 bacterium]|nr:hypothetical protein [candidate division WOR-3 bacterium]